MYGTIAVVSADNLGSLALGGFKESCSAIRMCRHCMATKENSKKEVMGTYYMYDHIIKLFSSMNNSFSFGMKQTTKSTVMRLKMMLQEPLQRNMA